MGAFCCELREQYEALKRGLDKVPLGENGLPDLYNHETIDCGEGFLAEYYLEDENSYVHIEGNGVGLDFSVRKWGGLKIESVSLDSPGLTKYQSALIFDPSVAKDGEGENPATNFRKPFGNSGCVCYSAREGKLTLDFHPGKGSLKKAENYCLLVENVLSGAIFSGSP